MQQKQQYIPLNTPPEQAELMMLDRFEPESSEERRILSAYNERLLRTAPDNRDVAEYEYRPERFKRSEIILHPVSVESAQTWFLSSIYVGGSIAVLAGAVYLLGMAAEFVGANLVGVQYIIAILLIGVLFFIVSKIKTRQTVVHEGGGTTINKTYNQYNDCKF